MKYMSLAAVAVLMLSACGPNEAEQKAAREKAVADSLAADAAMEKSYGLDLAASNIHWTGTMLGVKQHHGIMKLMGGKFSVTGGQLSGGNFTIDMNSIAPMDSAYAPDGSKQGTRDNLIGHLKSADFFDVATHPTATFEITSVEGNTAKGNLTVRGKTNEEMVSDVTVTMDGGVTTATGKVTFDRQKYGAAFSTGAKDMVINDNIELTVHLVSSAQ